MMKIAVLFSVSLLLMFAAEAAFAAVTVYNVTSLNGASESPPNASLGIGTGTITVDTVAQTMAIDVVFSGLTGATTAAHIHCCTTNASVGTAGVATTTPSFAGFPLGVTSGLFKQTLNMLDVSSYNTAFITANGGTVASAFSALLIGMNAGKSYFNLHTTTSPSGEIRSFLAAVIPGACGSANGVVATTAPSTNLCTPTPAVSPMVTSNVSQFSWGCAGSNGGSTASCTAPRQYTITASVNGSGGTAITAVPANGVVTYNSTGTVSFTPAAGYVIGSITGTCGGTLGIGTNANTFTTSAVTGDCTVIASFLQSVNGACGVAANVTSFAPPSLALCAAGTASPISSAAGLHTWSCSGSNGGTTASCQASSVIRSVIASAGTNGNTTATNSGPAQASFVSANGGAGCSFDPTQSSFILQPAAYPQRNASAPHGYFKFKLVNCTQGFTARISITWPSLTGSLYTKYGKTAASNGASVFFTPSNLTILSNMASFDVTDGGLGDDDLLSNGEIVDPSGPILLAAPEPVAAIPAANEIALVALLALLLFVGIVRIRTQDQA